MVNWNRMFVAICLVVGLTVLAGCGSSELGPADPNSVPKVDPGTIEKEIHREESMKHLPKGANIPAGIIPKDQQGTSAK
jgi:hypothetical protein